MGRALTPEDTETIRATSSGDLYAMVPGPGGEQRGKLLEVGTTRSLVQLQRSALKRGETPKLVVQSVQYSTTSVDTSSIREVTAVRHGRGAADGLLLGALIGAAFGAVLDAYGVVNDTCGQPGCLHPGAVLFGISGAAWGALIGGVIGHRTTYRFE
jgi:hypothetical protein